jgi:hypothetical protein
MAKVSVGIAVLGIDLGKNLCSVAGLDAAGAVVLRRRMRPETVAAFAAGLPPRAAASPVSRPGAAGRNRRGRGAQAEPRRTSARRRWA